MGNVNNPKLGKFRYKLLVQYDEIALAELIEQHVQQGWCLLGDPCVTYNPDPEIKCIQYAQAISRWEHS